ncbi:MAG: hypothetical protein IJI41_10765 [Anaerolineaceae bacterium]|nr:hypothetical protein [Anaerolineaceae bacterium]
MNKLYNVLVVVLIVISTICVIAFGIAVDLSKGLDYRVIEHVNGEKIVFVQPIVVNENNTSVYYLPMNEEV